MKKTENLIQVKQALADKYDHLANVTGSRVRRANYKRRADKYRRQAEALRQ